MRRRQSVRRIVTCAICLGAIGLGMLWTGQLAVVAADGQLATAHRLIIGWDDSVICCGPGTDAGMDSPQAIERMVKRWKARGIQGVYWRVDEAMLPQRYMTRWKTKVSPGMNYLLERVDQKLAEFPVLKTLLAAAEREQNQRTSATSTHRSPSRPFKLS